MQHSYFDLLGFHVHGYPNPWDEAPPWAIELREMVRLVLRKENQIMSKTDDLAAAVAAEDTVIDSAVVLIKGIPDLIAAAGADATKLQALQDDIRAKTATLAAALVIGTPAGAVGAPVVTPADANAAAAAAVAGT